MKKFLEMEKLNDKVRKRYAKIQPVVDRINILKELDIIASNVSNPHNKRNEKLNRSDDFNFEFKLRQCQTDFGNSMLARSETNENTLSHFRDTKVNENQLNEPLTNLQTEPPLSLDQSAHCPLAINPEPVVGKTKKQKHRSKNREKKAPSLFVGVRTELLNILKWILYVLLFWPIIFSGKLILAIVSLPISILCICISKLGSIFGIKTVSNKESSLLENKPDDSISLKEDKKNEEKLNFNEHLPDKIGDIIPGGRFVPLEDEKRSIEDDESLKKGVKNLILKKNLKKDDRTISDMSNWRNDRSKRQKDLSTVELSSNCVSDKYSGKFFSIGDCGKRKSAIRQYQSSISILKKSPLKGSQTMVERKPPTESKNSFNKTNDIRLYKKVSIDLSEATSAEFYEKNKLRHVDSRILNYNNIYSSDKYNVRSPKNSCAYLLINPMKKRYEKSKVHTVSCPPLETRAVSENESSSVADAEDKKGKLEDREISPGVLDRGKYFSRNSDSRSPIEIHGGIRKSQEPSSSAAERDSIKKNHQTKVPDVLDTEITESEGRKIVFREFDSGESKTDSLVTAAEVLPRLKNAFEIDVSVKKIKNDEVYTEKEPNFITESSNDGKELSDAKLRSLESSKSVAEFKKPVDAKSKWLEMKKKYYGNDYKAVESSKKVSESDKPEPRNLSRINSISKLPAQKIFQYNMLVGRARQIGAEPPLSTDNDHCNPSLRQYRENRGIEESHAMQICKENGKNNNHSQSGSKNFHRRLSQTQSLSQWISDSSGSSRAKKFLGEQKPKPKPRSDQGGSFNQGIKITGGADNSFKIPQPVAMNRFFNSSLDVRAPDRKRPVDHVTNRINGPKVDRLMGQRAVDEKLLQFSDGEIDDRKPKDKRIGNRVVNVTENLLHII